MMRIFDNFHPTKIAHFRPIIGFLLLLSGGVLFLDRYLRTGWLTLLVLPGIGLFLFLWGIRVRLLAVINAGCLVAGVGVGGLAILNPLATSHGLAWKLGMFSLVFGASWFVLFLTQVAVLDLKPWWALIPAGIFGSLGACLLFTRLQWTDFILFISLGIGLPLLIWGLFTRLIGLVIPGCLLVGIGPGIYLAWAKVEPANALVSTGTMLVWFALGWLLITVSARFFSQKYLWWPLIPGGILAMVGCGLYIGGNPSNALSFISNTGSIALMIFGLYLLLMRKGIHH
jgi:hypothetical protein